MSFPFQANQGPDPASGSPASLPCQYEAEIWYGFRGASRRPRRGRPRRGTRGLPARSAVDLAADGLICDAGVRRRQEHVQVVPVEQGRAVVPVAREVVGQRVLDVPLAFAVLRDRTRGAGKPNGFEVRTLTVGELEPAVGLVVRAPDADRTSSEGDGRGVIHLGHLHSTGDVVIVVLQRNVHAVAPGADHAEDGGARVAQHVQLGAVDSVPRLVGMLPGQPLEAHHRVGGELHLQPRYVFDSEVGLQLQRTRSAVVVGAFAGVVGPEVQPDAAAVQVLSVAADVLGQHRPLRAGRHRGHRWSRGDQRALEAAAVLGGEGPFGASDHRDRAVGSVGRAPALRVLPQGGVVGARWERGLSGVRRASCQPPGAA